MQIILLTYESKRSTKPNFPTRLRSASVLERRELKSFRGSVAPGSVSFRSTEQTLVNISGVQQNEARAGALLSKKLLCNLTVDRRSMMLFLFSPAMSITMMCGDPSPSISQHVEHCGGLLFHKIFPVL